LGILVFAALRLRVTPTLYLLSAVSLSRFPAYLGTALAPPLDWIVLTPLHLNTSGKCPGPPCRTNGGVRQYMPGFTMLSHNGGLR
jgi:hypothetical protein